MKEIWRDIKDYEGLYAVSNLGRVKSLNYNRTGKEKPLKPAKDRKGYLYVILCKNGVKKHFSIHRLVAEAFLPNPDGKPHIDHINTDKTDNRVENIRYCNRVENQNNPLSKQKMSDSHKGKSGVKHPRSKPIVGVNKVTGEEVWFACTYEAQRALGISHGNIWSCLKGRYKSTGGYYWHYA